MELSEMFPPASNQLYATAAAILSRHHPSDELLTRLEDAFVSRGLSIPADLTAQLMARGIYPASTNAQ